MGAQQKNQERFHIVEVHKTHSQETSAKGVFTAISTLAKELRKIRERPCGHAGTLQNHPNHPTLF